MNPDTTEARVEALRKWKGPTAVQNGERELDVVDFMGYITESNELIADLREEVKRLLSCSRIAFDHQQVLRDKESALRADVIEYVEHLTATPHVLRKLMGSPSQEHTIDNLAVSLGQLLDRLRGDFMPCNSSSVGSVCEHETCPNCHACLVHYECQCEEVVSA